MKTHTKKSDADEVKKLVKFMVENPDAQFGIYENEIFHNGKLVCTLASHNWAIKMIKVTREKIAEALAMA